ncbi:MAG: hypothetical protein HYX90_08495 [Chloroflexi bacterium]|nr:hypothetical protein [Chloroflexota bacterium]
MREPEPPATPLQEMDFRQLQLYARDLERLFWSEKQTRASLAEEKLVLEYKVRELSALNTLFQDHLREKQALLEAYESLLSRLKELAGKTPGDAAPLLRRLVGEAEAGWPAKREQPPGR